MRTRGRRVGGGAAAVVAAVEASARSPVARAVSNLPSTVPRVATAAPDVATTGDLFDPVPPLGPTPVRRAPASPGPPRPPDPTPALAPVPGAGASPASRHLWLALRCTDLPLRAVASAAAIAADAPLAIVDATHARRLVVACNPAAARHGVRPGLASNAAHALAPGLATRERDPALEERRLQVLARWGTGYTPFVSLEPPDTLLLEVRGSLRLFGGADALVARALRELGAHGHEVAHALATTPRGALWLARSAPGTLVESPARLAGPLAALPVTAAGWGERVYEQLARLGVRTLGELRRLPRDGLARRFEARVLADLDEAFGLVAAPRRRHVVPERFRERVELTCELEALGHMEPAIDRLLDRMGRFLRVRDAGVARLALTFVHRRAPPTCVTLGRGTPCGDPAEWRLLVRERLGRVQLPEPVVALSLRTSVALPAIGASVALPGLEAAQAQANAWALIDRLRARLGDAAVNGVCLVPEHRPERAWRRVAPRPTKARAAGGAREGAKAGRIADAVAARAAAATRRGGARAGAPAGEPPLPHAPRPLWLLADPERLRVHQGQPCHDGFLRFEAGPERIESGWWDGGDVVRDYYVASTRAGVRLWIYREPAGEGVRWFLHGVFG